eukprot:22469_1
MSIVIYSMSVRNPWAYLIAKGYKRLENRDKGISNAKYNQPIALHVPSKCYPKKERHKYYSLPVVQKYLTMDNTTKDIYNDYDKLDAFFSDMNTSIIAIIYIETTIKSIENTETFKYPFANVPEQRNSHWIINKIYLLPSPIPNYCGNLGVTEMIDKKAISLIKTFLATLKQFSTSDKNSITIPSKKPTSKTDRKSNAKSKTMVSLKFHLTWDEERPLVYIVKWWYYDTELKNHILPLDDAFNQVLQKTPYGVIGIGAVDVFCKHPKINDFRTKAILNSNTRGIVFTDPIFYVKKEQIKKQKKKK